MKKATNRILSFLTAFAMVIGVLVAPFTSANASEVTPSEKPETEVTIPGEATTSTKDGAETGKVTVHKILMSKDAMEKHDKEKKYQGGKLDIKTFFEDSAEDIGEVYFVWKTEDGSKFIKANKDNKLAPSFAEDGTVETTDNIEEAMGGSTKKDAGVEFVTTGLKGKFQIHEIHEKSTYVGKDGKTLTDMKAVPVLLTLPLRNEKGTVLEAHVYPKNTEEKPKIDKNFKKGNNLTKIEDTNENLGAGAVYENYTKDKALASQELDKNVPYEIKTEIPAKAKYAQAYWDDIMTKGLTYNKDLMITINGEPAELDKDYTLTRNDERGFKAEFTEAGLKKINNQAAAVTVMLTYSAKINKDAVIDIPESNNVRFFYGNNKGKGNTPVPTNPKNGELTVKKNWDDGVWAEGESATFKLVDANTGKDVTAKDLVNAPDDYTFEGTVTLKKGDTETYTWKYLNDEKQYKAVEIDSTTMSDAEYTIDENGNIVVTNHKSNNPQPLEPTTPKVETYGKKFVKVNEADERLPGAEFVIKKKDTEDYLAEKADKDIKADQEAATKAKEALDNAVKTYNALEADKQTETEKAKVTKAQEDLNAAVVKANEFYVWGKKDAAKKFTSNEAGQFEVTRLDKGTYTLVETKAPDGYASRDDIDFEVGPGTYSKGNIDYTADSNKNDAEKVVNRKVSIPQTGGIGSLIFIVAGLAIMGLAFVMKRRNAVEA